MLRPQDLLVLSVRWRGLTLVDEMRTGEPRRILKAGEEGGLLCVRFDYQHTAESALFAEPPQLPKPVPLEIKAPVGARGADESRLVYRLAPGDAIDWSISGLLEAMGRLELSVAPAAATAADTSPPALGGLFTGWTGGQVTRRLLEEIDGPAVTRLGSDAASAREGQRAMRALNRLRVDGGLELFFRGASASGLDAGGDTRLTNAGRRPRVTERGRGSAPLFRFWELPEIRRPLSSETAIEAPFRLILSPSRLGAWVHATLPRSAKADGAQTSRSELWHTTLTVKASGRAAATDKDAERIVRAIWTRDRDGQSLLPFDNLPRPFDREVLVRQSAGTDLAPKVRPRPVQVNRLALSALGAWLDVSGRWRTESYSDAFNGALESWVHRAPMGRDQYVRLVRKGYLFPLGHEAALVEIQYRQIVGGTNPQAALFRKNFIVVREQQRNYTNRDFPFISCRLEPLRTPDLEEIDPLKFAWPIVQSTGKPFSWKIKALDHDGNSINLEGPLLWVPVMKELDTDQTSRNQVLAAYRSVYSDTDHGIDARGQSIAFAPALAASEGAAEASASVEAHRLLLDAIPASSSSQPFLRHAKVIVPAMKRLTPAAPLTEVGYPQTYKDHGFEAANAGNVFLELSRFTGYGNSPNRSPESLVFGSAERSGGFIRPDISVAGLARSTGLVSDIDDAASGKFDPAKLFGAGLPKLFGLIDLADIIGFADEKSPLDLAPAFVTEALDRIAGLLADLATLKDAVTQFGLDQPSPGTQISTLAGEIEAAIDELLQGDVEAIGNGRITSALSDMANALDALEAAVSARPNDPMMRATFDRLIGALRPVLTAVDTVAEAIRFAQGLLASGGDFRARMDWRPKVRNWPKAKPVFLVDEEDKALVVSVEARTNGGKPSGLEVAAQLSNFHFNLLPGFELMEVHFDRLAFRASGARKPEIDIVFNKLEFVGVLSFVEVLKELIPLDGFSDPPFLDVSTEGISAGFTVALPNLAIGVFSLTNISLGADARVPFLGDVISVGFNFCTRERPFTLAVAFLGGGGFIGIRLAPDGLILLEGAFEFGAVVALDFGVASGSVSVMAGIYFKIEGDEGQLTGYVRIRGEVDVLSLITASLELYLGLTYYTSQDKLIGEAEMKIKVEVLLFSASVTVRARRTFAGSNGDPTVADMLEVSPITGESTVWEDYLAAFAPAQVEA